jgi:glycopeptide antibiotics resistance protein
MVSIDRLHYISYSTYLMIWTNRVHHSNNLISFKTIRLHLMLGMNKASIINFLGNIVSFILMGILLPIVSRKSVCLKAIIFISTLVSVIIELI